MTQRIDKGRSQYTYHGRPRSGVSTVEHRRRETLKIIDKLMVRADLQKTREILMSLRSQTETGTLTTKQYLFLDQLRLEISKKEKDRPKPSVLSNLQSDQMF